MSPRHPVIAITGSSGAGTTTVTTTFQQIFRREGVRTVIVDGDAFYRYDRSDMRVKMAEAQTKGQMHARTLVAQSMNWPPLMVSVEPVIQPASSAARKVTQRATSSTSPRRPTGICPTIDFITSSDTPASSSVAT
jgi:phosphoribulokinase